MRRLALALVALAVLPATTAARTTAVGIGLREYQVALGRETVRPGTVRFNITNVGEDGHDFAVRTRGGTVLRTVPELGAGDQLTARVRLKRPGRYVLFCTLPGHEALGMKATLRVRRR